MSERAQPPEPKQNPLALSAQLVKVRPPVQRSTHSPPPANGETLTAEPVELPPAAEPAPAAPPPAGNTATDDTAPPASASSLKTPNIANLPPPTEPLELFVRNPNRYEILGEHGRGGLGRVMRARDKDLDRSVAIKELLRPSRTAEARFVREATITAKLQHPGIVPVHEAGRWPDGTPFYAMKLVEGRSLRELIAATSNLAERLPLIAHVIAVAEAVGFAHSRGVVHRDLKPSNIVVGEHGETVVIDWGLARIVGAPSERSDAAPYRASQATDVTVAGAILGTPAYMAPEQRHGHAADERSDVYSLGSILFEVVTGTRPFADVERAEILRMSPDDASRLLRVAMARTPPDLVAILTKATNPVPSKRYSTASAMAEDLKRYTLGLTVRARTYTAFERVARWIDRRRAIAATIAASLVLLAGLSAIAVRRIVSERDAADKSREAAETLLGVTREQRDELLLASARGSLSTDPTATISLVSTYSGPRRPFDRVQFLAAAAQARGVARRVVRAHLGGIVAVQFLQGGGYYSLGKDGKLNLFDVAGSPPVLIESGLGEARAADLSRDGRWLVKLDNQARLVAHDLHEGGMRVLVQVAGVDVKPEFSENSPSMLLNRASGPMLYWGRPDAGATSIDGKRGWISPDGLRLVFTRSDGVYEWSAQRGASRRLAARDAFVTSVAFGASGLWSFALDDGRVFLCDTKETRLVLNAGEYAQVVLSRDAQSLVVSDIRGKLIVAGLTSDRRDEYSLPGEIHQLAVLADDWIAANGTDGRIYLLNSATGTTRTLLGHQPGVLSFDASLDGRYLVSGGYEGSVRIWEVPSLRERVLRGHHDAVFQVRYVPGKAARAVTTSRDRTVRLWDLSRSNTGSEPLQGHSALVYGLDVSPDGASAVSASWDGTVRLWGLEERTGISLRGHEGPVRVVRFVNGGTLVASGGADGTVRLWNLDGSQREVLRSGGAEVYALAVSRDRRYLAAGSNDGTIDVWALDTGEWRTLSGHDGMAYRLVFAPDNDLISAGFDGRVMRWSVDTWSAHEVLRHSGPIREIALTSDGVYLASSGDDGAVLLFDFRTSTKTSLLSGGSRVQYVAFSADGRRIVACGHDASVTVWDLTTGRERVLLGHEGFVVGADFSEDGQRLLTASWDGAVREWPIGDLLSESPPSEVSALQAWLVAATNKDAVFGAAPN